MNIADNISAITALSIDGYLHATGWTRDISFPNKNLMVFDHGLSTRIAIPSNDTYEDFQRVLTSVLPTIGSILEKEPSEVIKEMLSVYNDRIEFRVITPKSPKGKLPLGYASNCVDGIHELILSSACADHFAQPICMRKTIEAKSLAGKFNLDQTEIGSYVFNIDIQVVNDKHEQLVIEETPRANPPEHRIVERIVTAFNQIDTIVKNDVKVSDILENAYISGITANMCDALMKFYVENEDIEIETTARYSSLLAKKVGVKYIKKIGSEHFYVIDDIAKRYRDRKISDDATLSGYVKTLSKRGSSIDSMEKTIKLETEYEGHMRMITIELSDEDYRAACDAHRDGQRVELKGVLDMSSRTWSLNEVSYLRLV